MQQGSGTASTYHYSFCICSQAHPSAPPYSPSAVGAEFPDPVKPSARQQEQQQDHSSSIHHNQAMASGYQVLVVITLPCMPGMHG